MKLSFKQKFNTRQEISVLLGGDTQKGIAVSAQTDTILLFMNDGEIYTDYFYPTGSYSHCMYTGIGRRGHQDSPDENKHMYHLNIEVLSHRTNKKHLLVFEKKDKAMYFVGEYRLTEMHQNVQPDENGMLRRVFVFHLTQVSDYFEC